MTIGGRKCSPYEVDDFVDVGFTGAVTRRVGTRAVAATTPKVPGVHVLQLWTCIRRGNVASA